MSALITREIINRWIELLRSNTTPDYTLSIATRVWFTDEQNARLKELGRLNDQEGITFAQLADWIEENLRDC